MKAHCTWAFVNGFTKFSLSPCACFKTHTASRLSAAGKLWAASCTRRAHSAQQGVHSSSFLPGSRLSLDVIYDDLHCQFDGTKGYQPPRASLSLGKTAHFPGAMCSTCQSLRYFRSQSASMRALKSLWTNHFELLHTCSSQVGIKRCSLLQGIVWWRTH